MRAHVREIIFVKVHVPECSVTGRGRAGPKQAAARDGQRCNSSGHGKSFAIDRASRPCNKRQKQQEEENGGGCRCGSSGQVTEQHVVFQKKFGQVVPDTPLQKATAMVNTVLREKNTCRTVGVAISVSSTHV